MALGKKYKVEFKDYIGNDVTVHLWKEGFSGTQTALTGAYDPLHIFYNGDEENQFTPIIPSRAELTLIGTTRGEFDEFYTYNDREWYLSVDYGSIQVWGGYVLAEQYEEEYCHTKYHARIVATDGLEDLKNYQYLNSGSYYVGLEDLFTIIRNVMSIGQMSIRYAIRDSFEEDSNVLSTQQLDQTQVYQERFIDDSGEAWNCYDVLKTCLTWAGYVIRVGGVHYSSYHGYWIYNPQDLLNDSLAVNVYGNTGTYAFGRTPQCYRTIGTDFEIINSDAILNYGRPYKKGVITLDAGKKENLIKNGSFSDEWWDGDDPDHWDQTASLLVTNESGAARLTTNAASQQYLSQQLYFYRPLKMTVSFAYKTSASFPAYFCLINNNGTVTQYYKHGTGWVTGGNWYDTANINILSASLGVFTHVEYDLSAVVGNATSSNYYELRFVQPNNGTDYIEIDDVRMEAEWYPEKDYILTMPETYDYEEANDTEFMFTPEFQIELGDNDWTGGKDVYWGTLYDKDGNETDSWSYGSITGESSQDLLAEVHMIAHKKPYQVIRGTIKQTSDSSNLTYYPFFSFEDPNNVNSDYITRKFLALNYDWSVQKGEYSGTFRELIYNVPGSNLITSMGQHAADYNWTTSTFGATGCQLYNNGADDALAYSNDIAMTSGYHYLVKFNIDFSGTGDDPVVGIGDASDGLNLGSSAGDDFTLIEGNNGFIYTPTTTANKRFYIRSNDSGTMSITITHSVQLIEGYN